jgi:hypothetical protein
LEGGGRLIMIYIIISVVFVLVALGCLKSKFNGGIIPVCIFCFGLSALVTSGIVVYKFFTHPEDHKIESKIIKRDGIFSIDKDEKDTYKFKAERGEDYQITTKNIVKKDTLTFVKTVDYTLIYPAKDILPDIHFKVKTEDTIHLSPKDYAVYKAYKDSVVKRR